MDNRTIDEKLYALLDALDAIARHTQDVRVTDAMRVVRELLGRRRVARDNRHLRDQSPADAAHTLASRLQCEPPSVVRRVCAAIEAGSHADIDLQLGRG